MYESNMKTNTNTTTKETEQIKYVAMQRADGLLLWVAIRPGQTISEAVRDAIGR